MHRARDIDSDASVSPSGLTRSDTRSVTLALVVRYSGYPDRSISGLVQPKARSPRNSRQMVPATLCVASTPASPCVQAMHMCLSLSASPCSVLSRSYDKPQHTHTPPSFLRLYGCLWESRIEIPNSGHLAKRCQPTLPVRTSQRIEKLNSVTAMSTGPWSGHLPQNEKLNLVITMSTDPPGQHIFPRTKS